MSQTTKEQLQEFEADYKVEPKGTINMLGVKPISIKQIGGNHYLNKIQPWDIIDSWELNFYEGNILKYLLRDKGNRVEDLQKLIHYAEKLINLTKSELFDIALNIDKGE